MNPLLDFAGLPRFDAIQPSDVQPAISQLLAEARAEVERLYARWEEAPDVPPEPEASSGTKTLSEFAP